MIVPLTNQEFINKSKKVHKNKFDYSKVNYINSQTKIEIICPIHGSFFQTPNNHLRNRGCLCCSKIKKLLPCEFIERAKKIHKGKYDYSKTRYINHKTKVIIICNKHGEFLQNTNHHLRGNGCSDCGGSAKLTIKEFINRSTKKHKNKFDYSKAIYINNSTKVEIVCSKHGSFFQSPNLHMMGEKCPKCSNRISRLETDFLEYLNIPNTKDNRQVYILNKQVDGYYKNIVYEFLGDYYHGNPSVYDKNKYNPTCKKTFGELYDITIKKFLLLKHQGYKICLNFKIIF